MVLGSTSRYRRELMERLRVPFTVAAPDVDETPLSGESPKTLALRLALAKAKAVAALHPEAVVIGSDQVADLAGQPLGKPGVQGKGTDVFTEPNAVIVAKNGDIFVADGHEADRGVARILKYDKTGKFLMQWGQPGKGQGDLEVPHALAMDSKGLLYVGDRWNNRVQVYTQKGKLLNSWTQFGRPSGLFIDANDIMYSGDSESRRPVGYGYNPGWQRGIRIGSVKDGKVTAFIPDPDPNPDGGATSGAEGLWVDKAGVIYGAQVKERTVARHIRAK